MPRHPSLSIYIILSMVASAILVILYYQLYDARSPRSDNRNTVIHIVATDNGGPTHTTQREYYDRIDNIAMHIVATDNGGPTHTTQREYYDTHSPRIDSTAMHTALATDYGDPTLTTQRKVQPRHMLHPIEKSMILPCGPEDPLCIQYLLQEDRRRFYNCATAPKGLDIKASKCRFMNASNRAPVVLTSFPGSGNTWVRGLLELATGICTGSVYCDKTLEFNGLLGEWVTSGRVLVVKCHSMKNKLWNLQQNSTEKPWGGVVLIVRNPLDALVAEWNRKKAKSLKNLTTNIHVLSVGPEYFGENAGWRTFVTTKVREWKAHFLYWYFTGSPALVVYYEDIKSNTLREMKRILDFLKFPYSEVKLRNRMATDFNAFHRTQHPEFEHFTPELRDTVKESVKEMVEVLKKKNNGDTLGLEEYL